ncbi:MAG: serine O-acetyltransferase EpsC [Acidobacteriota bacterium]
MSGTTALFRDLAGRLDSGSPRRQASQHRALPSRQAVVELLATAEKLLCPRHLGCRAGGQIGALEASLSRLYQRTSEQVQLELSFMGKDEFAAKKRAQEIVQAWMAELPALQAVLELDVEAAYKGDPALYSTDEALLCYPGITAIIYFRLAHELRVLGAPLLARMMTEHAHSVSGIDIHPGAQIGEAFFIDHGTGVVIGETAVIGKRVRLYQGVTLGAKNFPSDCDGTLRKGLPRHPILEDDVVVYSWANVLGRITIGRGSIIGGNAWVTHDVAPGSIITQARLQQAMFADGAGI